jgi:tripartite-type tricarboxylate transporter receptor subunit TctC
MRFFQRFRPTPCFAAQTSKIAWALAMLVGISTSNAAAQSVEEFYKGKTITISVGFTPGGSYDFYARLFANHMGKYIPGNPSFVVQNMPGAGSLRAANHLFNVAPKDGTALGVVTQTVMLEPLLGTPEIKYSASKFTYIGRMSGVLDTVSSWHAAKAQNIYDVRTYETIAGGSGPTSPSVGYSRLMNAFAGTKFKVVLGFGGTAETMLAIERREIDAAAVNWNSILRFNKRWLDQKKINVLVQVELERSKELPHVPTMVELGKTADDKAALAFYTSSAAVGRSLIGAPGIPADRVNALREAFLATTRDPDFLAEIKKTGSEFSPATGEYLEELAKNVEATPPDVIKRTAAALQAE